MQLRESSCLLCGKQRVSHSTRSAERDPSVLACKVVVWQNGMLAAVLIPIDSKTCDYQKFVSAIDWNQTCSLGFTGPFRLSFWSYGSSGIAAWPHDQMNALRKREQVHWIQSVNPYQTYILHCVCPLIGFCYSPANASSFTLCAKSFAVRSNASTSNFRRPIGKSPWIYVYTIQSSYMYVCVYGWHYITEYCLRLSSFSPRFSPCVLQRSTPPARLRHRLVCQPAQRCSDEISPNRAEREVPVWLLWLTRFLVQAIEIRMPVPVPSHGWEREVAQILNDLAELCVRSRPDRWNSVVFWCVWTFGSAQSDLMNIQISTNVNSESINSTISFWLCVASFVVFPVHTRKMWNIIKAMTPGQYAWKPWKTLSKRNLQDSGMDPKGRMLWEGQPI